VFDAEQATALVILQWFMDSRHEASLIAHKNGALGEDSPMPSQTWGL